MAPSVRLEPVKACVPRATCCLCKAPGSSAWGTSLSGDANVKLIEAACNEGMRRGDPASNVVFTALSYGEKKSTENEDVTEWMNEYKDTSSCCLDFEMNIWNEDLRFIDMARVLSPSEREFWSAY